MEKPENFNEKLGLFDLLLEVSAQMNSLSDMDQLIAFFVNKIAEILQVARVSFMLLDEAKGVLFIKASYGLDLPTGKAIIKLGEMFGGRVAQDGHSLLVKDVDAEFPKLAKDRLSRYQTKSFIIVPIKLREGVIGILCITDKKDLTVFTEGDLGITNLLCHFFALHIENIRLLDKNVSLLTEDALTGLFNHRYFQEQLIKEVYRAERYQHPLSLMLMDIDNFCWYNQNYGYSAGDNALKQIGRILKENTRRVDVAARYGPEEFMLILPDTRLKQALVVAERIKESISYSVPAQDGGSSFGMAKLTVSIGVTEHKIGLGKEELIRRVVNALLEAKQKGKNRVCASKI